MTTKKKTLDERMQDLLTEIWDISKEECLDTDDKTLIECALYTLYNVKAYSHGLRRVPSDNPYQE